MADAQPKTDGEEKPEKVSFWKTAPGILTGIAALVTASAALLTAADKAGFFAGDSKPPQQSDSGGSIATSGDGSPVIQDTSGDVTVTVDQ